MAKKIYDSPGVYTSEKDITYTVETLGITTLGAVGETKKGPAFQPIFTRNYDEFLVTFGGTSPEKFKNTQIVKYELPYIAKSYLTQSNQLYVTRVLGLSGYDSGMSYALRTVGTIDQATLYYSTISTVLDFMIDVTGTSANFTVSGGTVNLIDRIASLTSVAKTKFDSAYSLFFNTSYYTTRNWFNSNVMYWGIMDSDAVTGVTEDRNTQILYSGAPANPSFIDSYELPVGIPSTDETTYILNHEFTFHDNVDRFTGKGFSLYAYDIDLVSGTTYSGKVKINTYSFVASPIEKYHKKLIASLKSRGGYISDHLGFIVDPSVIGLGSITEALSDPLASFEITGTTTGGTDYSYTVSLDKTKKNYIKNVLGTKANDKDTYLFVEEVYDSVLNKGWHFGYIKGLHAEILPIETWGHYKFQYQSPSTPFFVSELRGGIPQRLFRIISISDGDNANTEIKASIANVNLDRGTFDVYVRSFNDTDKSPVFLEKFLGLSMSESASNYIGRKIGTIDNKYPLKSSYVIIEMADNAPSDAVPAGFEGYEFRTYGDNISGDTFCGVPEITYKTKYYKAGDLIVDPPDATSIYSSGDRIRKIYLGFTDLDYGFDTDLVYFKGKRSLDESNTYNDGSDWTSKTKGFHLDINASNVVDSQNNEVFAYGQGTFVDATAIASDPTHPYYDINTRKFTALFAGGFDGWDVYRDQRTNSDDYKIGKTNFVRSGFDTFNSVEYKGDLFGTSDYYAYLYAMRTFENPEQTVINVLVTPGIDIINNTELVREGIEIIEDKRFDSIYLPTLPDIKLIGNTNPANTDDWYYPNDIVSALEVAELDSNYTAVYYPWIQISDTENNANIYIPPTAEVVKDLAFTDNVAQPWYAIAGYERGIVNCIRTRIILDQESRDTLYPGRINPIATFSDVGTVIWGNKNLQIKSSALDRLNIRRLMLQARKLIMAVSNRLLFDPNDNTIRSQFLSLVNPILDNIRKERGLIDFRVKLENEVSDEDRNTMTGKIFIKPTPTLEFIELEFVVTPTSVSFDNI